MKTITKGSCVYVYDIWYVVIDIFLDKENNVVLGCVCDHANNRHMFYIEEITYIIDPYTAIRIKNWGQLEPEDFEKFGITRPLPIEQIAEVLSGCHDDMFDDYKVREDK